MEITVLGPLELRIDGMVVPLGGPKPRVLLAVLALHANEVVSRDRLIEALWGDRPPPSVDQSLDTYVSRLRRTLGNERLSRRSGGYVLTIGPDELDSTGSRRSCKRRVGRLSRVTPSARYDC